MRRLFSYTASASATGIGLLLLRLGFGALLMVHGYDKIQHYSEISQKFIPFLGMSPSVSLSLCIFAEFVCGLLVAVGLLTRLACVPILINMAVAVFQVHQGDVTGQAQAATLFLVTFLALLFTGAGKYSVDAAIYKH